MSSGHNLIAGCRTREMYLMQMKKTGGSKTDPCSTAGLMFYNFDN